LEINVIPWSGKVGSGKNHRGGCGTREEIKKEFTGTSVKGGLWGVEGQQGNGLFVSVAASGLNLIKSRTRKQTRRNTGNVRGENS